MRKLFRVFPRIAGAPPGNAGHPLFIPADVQGAGRLDNPVLYRVLYASDSPVGACAERFGQVPLWRGDMLWGRRGPLALATLVLTDDRVCDLDDARELLERDLRPSDVVSRDRERTQAWAARIYDEGSWSGARWWSYWEPSLASFGIWREGVLRVTRVEQLTPTSAALREAAEVLNRPWH